MSSSTGRQTAISLTPPPKPRLRLQPDRSARTLLDGGWWPRSADPAGSRVVRLGWFAGQPAGLLTATSARGQRTDLLTVPPDASEQDAHAAMEQAAQPGNRSHTPALLAAVTPLTSPAAVTAPPSIQLSIWEWEGGQLRDRTLPAASARPHATLLPAAGPRHP
jgi:Family of unknown function (DUF5994)